MTTKECAKCPYLTRKNKCLWCEFHDTNIGNITNCKLANQPEQKE